MSQTLIERAADLSCMAREATATIPLKPETKQLIQKRKKDGKTYDLWMREQMNLE